MLKRRLLLATAMALTAPLPLYAQATSAGAFVAAAPAGGGSTRMVGLMAGLSAGPLGLRLSGAMDAAGTPADFVASADAHDSGAWSADADVQLTAPRVGLAGLPIRPAAFAGVGLRQVSYRPAFDAPTQSQTVPVFSYGGRLALPITGWLAIEGEARRRSAFDADWRAIVDGWEYRAGFALRFGGNADRGAARPAPGRPRGRPAGPAVYGGARSDASAAEIADAAIELGERYIGTRYTWGGESPRTGFDCSGFVQYVFARQGIRLPRVSREQAHAGMPLPASLAGLARGDLMFFASGGVISHVAIYAGSGRILHSTSSGGGVRYDDLSGRRGRWFRTHLVAARRIIRAGQQLRTPSRALPLDDAFEAIAAYDRGDDAPAP